MGNSYILGITGCSGSGKTHFLKSLQKRFGPEELSVISQDNYYIPRNNQPIDDKGIKNFDLPESIDLEAFYQDILRVREGETVERTEYTYNNPKKPAGKIIVNPAPMLIVEGIFIFSHPHIRDLINLKIYIDAKDHIRLKRRIIRDNEERGYDLEDVLYRYENHVIPTFEKHIEPYKMFADLIIPNDHHFDQAIEVLASYMKTKLPS